MECHADALNPKTFWNSADDMRCFERVLVEIENRFAFRAHEVMMWFGHGINAERTVMQADFAQNSAFDECVQGLVDSRQGDAGYLLAHDCVDLFRARMTGSRYQRFVDDATLVRHGETLLAAQFAKFRLLRRFLHSRYSMPRGL